MPTYPTPSPTPDPWFSNPQENENYNFERERLYEVGPNQQQPEDATPASFTDRIINGVIGLVGARRAEAEIIPQDQESADTLNLMLEDPTYEGVVRRAHEDKRRVQVISSDKDTRWMHSPVHTDGSPILGIYMKKLPDPLIGSVESVIRPERVIPDAPKRNVNVDQIYVRPNIEQGGAVYDWTAEDKDVRRRRAGTMSHELGHFLVEPLGMQSETMANIIGQNPLDPYNFILSPKAEAFTPQTLKEFKDWYWMGGDKKNEQEFGKETQHLFAPADLTPIVGAYTRALKEALGDRGRSFMGPPRERPPLRFYGPPNPMPGGTR